jgi:hypothetical protein
MLEYSTKDKGDGGIVISVLYVCLSSLPLGFNS